MGSTGLGGVSSIYQGHPLSREGLRSSMEAMDGEPSDNGSALKRQARRQLGGDGERFAGDSIVSILDPHVDPGSAALRADPVAFAHHHGALSQGHRCSKDSGPRHVDLYHCWRFWVIDGFRREEEAPRSFSKRPPMVWPRDVRTEKLFVN